jgi:hypothetical protein
MTESIEQGSNQTKHFSHYGLVSALLSIVGLACFVVFARFSNTEKVHWFAGVAGEAFLLLELMAFFAALLGTIRAAWHLATKRGGTLSSPGDEALLILGGALSLFFIAQAVDQIVREMTLHRHGHAQEIAQWAEAANLEELGKAMTVYSRVHNGRYPASEKWCDALMEEVKDLSPDARRCLRGEGQCRYAMNPLADPCSAPDVVLLFDCDAGWNQHGGAEILTMRHQRGKSCNVLFVNGHVEFIEAEKISLLRWEGKAGM